jgi:hypothetical protein
MSTRRTRRRRRLPVPALYAAALAVLPAGPVAARQSAAYEAPSARAARAGSPIRIDGRLDDAAWADAPVLAGFSQREPLTGQPASERTEVRILFDDDALYIGAWLHDRNAGAIVPGENRRDADLADADAFIVLLDTYLDRQNGFVFATTPAGIEHDGQVTREGQGSVAPGQRMQPGAGGGFNRNWDGSWQVATTRDAGGWYAEMRIPFATLRYGRGGAQVWGLNLARRIRRNNEESFWAPIPRQFDLYRFSLAGTLEGVEAPARRALTVTPFVLAAGRRDYIARTSATMDGDIGGDAKIGLTPGLALDLTVNTDFAQVEVDDEQVNLTRFRLFFPEKRPFFLENAGTFAVGTPQETELFFSRRIGIQDGRQVPIDAGGRLSGRIGGFSVGLLGVHTQGLGTRDPIADSIVPLAPPNLYSVARVMRELPRRSRLGVAVVNRLDTDDRTNHNTAVAVDGRLGIGSAVQLDGYAAHTSTPGLDGPAHAWSISGQYADPDWRMQASFREVGRDFNPEAGFVNRVDYRFFNVRGQRNFRFPEVSWFRELRPHILYREWRDRTGFLESNFLHIDSHFEFSNGAFFQLPAINIVTEGLREPFAIAPGVVVPPGTYRGVEWGFAFNTDLSAPFSVQGRIDIGSFYSGHRTGTNTTVNARLGESFVAGLRVNWYDVDLAEGSFETTVLGLRAAWSFSPRMYLQSLVQYNNQTRNVSSNLRFGWLSTAGTGLYIVYNDIEHTGPFERTGFDRGPQERALIIKFTRLFELR